MDDQEIAKLLALRERIRQADKRYREKHADKITENRKIYYEENKDAIREKNREYQRVYRAKKKAGL
jgi:hypothetical protein